MKRKQLTLKGEILKDAKTYLEMNQRKRYANSNT
jgi:hypothetical protein